MRASGGALATGDKILGALHHDFYICILVPSVTLKSDVPDNANDSFYKGTALFPQLQVQHVSNFTNEFHLYETSYNKDVLM